MAVQKNRKSHSRSNTRRSHARVPKKITLAADPRSGEVHRRHHVAPDGYYRGHEIIPRTPEQAAAEE